MVDIQTYAPILVAVATAGAAVFAGKRWLGLRNVVHHFSRLVSVYYIAKADGSYSPTDKDAIVECVGQFFDAVETEIEIVRPE